MFWWPIDTFFNTVISFRTFVFNISSVLQLQALLATNHVLPACHHPLVNDFGCIVSPCVNMNTFFDDGVGTSS